MLRNTRWWVSLLKLAPAVITATAALAATVYLLEATMPCTFRLWEVWFDYYCILHAFSCPEHRVRGLTCAARSSLVGQLPSGNCLVVGDGMHLSYQYVHVAENSGEVSLTSDTRIPWSAELMLLPPWQQQSCVEQAQVDAER